LVNEKDLFGSADIELVNLLASDLVINLEHAAVVDGEVPILGVGAHQEKSDLVIRARQRDLIEDTELLQRLDMCFL